MSTRAGRWLVAGLGAILACARMGPPPGGPPDLTPPHLLSRFPDTMVVQADFDDPAEFVFDEVISEGSAPNFGLGTGSLESLVLLSPSNEVPVVRWRRNRITVRPREGWVPNRVYRIQLLPGVTDLRTNRLGESAIITFTTGAPTPSTTLDGLLVDWTTRRPQVNGVIEAILLPDSLSYRTLTDSTGRFALGPLPAGEYLVYGGIDQNRNNRIEVREIFDSVRAGPGTASVGEIWAFRHDSVGPRIQSVALRDSVTIIIALNQPADPRQSFTPEMVRVRQLPDSTPVGVLAVHPPAVFDSLFPVQPTIPRTAADSARADSLQRVRARADSLRADSLAQAALREAEQRAEDARRGIVRRSDINTPSRALEAVTTRPALIERLHVRVDSVLVPGGRYIVEILGVTNPNGAATTGFLVLVVPEPPPPAPADTAAVPPDTGAVRRLRLTQAAPPHR